MKVLVTGATSGLGRNAVEYLRNKGISVRATGRNEAMGKLLSKMGAEFIPADLTELVSSQAKVMQHYGSVLLPRGGSALVDMTYYENAVHAMWLASQPACDHLPSARAWNISNGEPRTLRSIVQKLIDELGIKCRIRSVPYPMLDIIARSMERFGDKTAKEPAFTHYGVSKLNFDFTLDITRAQDELGYQPVVTLDDGIVRTAAWLRDHGKLHR